MKKTKLTLLLTLPEYDTLEKCVADALHHCEVFAGEDSALAATCSCLLKKIKEARQASASCASCRYCEPWVARQVATGNSDLALCHVDGFPSSEAYLSDPACKRYIPNPAFYD